MALFPISYISSVGYGAVWGGDTTPDTSKNLDMPDISSTCDNVAIVFTAAGIDWAGSWTFFDSDGTQDAEFFQVFNNAGGTGGHNDLRVYCRTNASKYDNKILNVRYSGGGTYGNARASWWENVRQVPSCDTVMSTAATSGYAPWSTNSAMVSIGVSVAYDNWAHGFEEWTGGAIAYSLWSREDGNSTANHSQHDLGWQVSPDTASSDYVLAIASAGVGVENRYTFEIFPYEVVLSNPVGALILSGEIDKKLSLTRFVAGTLLFTNGVLALRKLYKFILDATIRMWITPQSEPIEIDTDPKGFTDIGDDA